MGFMRDWNSSYTRMKAETQAPISGCKTLGMTVTRSPSSRLSQLGFRTSRQLGVMDMGRKSELLENPNGVPVEVDFIPLQPVPGRNRVGMMVVMPPISETQQCHPPIVG